MLTGTYCILNCNTERCGLLICGVDFLFSVSVASPSALGGGAVAGIVIVMIIVAAVVLLGVAAALFIIIRKKRAKTYAVFR